MRPSTRAEHELLLCCARTVASTAQRQRIRELAESQIDWEYFFLLARRHAILPLIYRQLQKHASDLVPTDQLQRLRKHYQENGARNQILTSELLRLIQIFSHADIEAIPYKGPLLAQYAYGDLTLRRFVDLDVMVRRDDVQKARELLLADGYFAAKSMSGAQQEVLLRTQHNMQFTRDNRHYIVELHWEVASHLFASSVDSETLWRSLESTELCGSTIKTFSAEDLLFSLCIHGSRHLWERLSWVCDVAELIQRHRVNWSALLQRLRKTDTERMFYLGLLLADDLLECDLPDEIRAVIKSDKQLAKVAERIAGRLFDGTVHVPATTSEIFRYNFQVRKSWRARVRYFVFMLRPTDGDLSTVSLPQGLGFAYYLMRPFRLLSKHS
ncbi:MAG: hypothetical protein C5B55_03385 [Blastocatellia bacterium]|nr:MAG: hypothetical protein C5B55_03385 [Blastocatellia bacterium]